MLTNLQYCDKALEYIDTPFRHQGRLKGIGLDCAGLVICVAKELGIYKGGDTQNYSRIPDGHFMLANLKEWMVEIDLDDIQPGDILLQRFESQPQHVAIYMPNNQIIHSYATLGKVTLHNFDEEWRNRTIAAFRWPEFV